MGKIKDLFDSYFKESVNDKNILKAIFMAGGGGSGKSFISAEVIGKKGPVSALGAVVVNSDDFIEKLFKKIGLPLIFNKDNKNQYAKQIEVRALSKALAKSKLKNVLNGLLPVVLDGTGKDFEKIISQAKALQEIGYDINMVFVNTTLEVAKQRNKQRERIVPDDVLVKTWKEVQSNLGKFQSFFGSDNFKLIDNSKFLAGEDLKKIQKDLFKIGKKFIESPLKNRKGLALVKALRSTGGKLLSDVQKIPDIKV